MKLSILFNKSVISAVSYTFFATSISIFNKMMFANYSFKATWFFLLLLILFILFLLIIYLKK